jgi:hypothetical protein
MLSMAAGISYLEPCLNTWEKFAARKCGALPNISSPGEMYAALALLQKRLEYEESQNCGGFFGIFIFEMQITPCADEDLSIKTCSSKLTNI